MTHVREAEVREVLVDFYSPVARADIVIWTEVGDRLRVRLGAGSYVALGTTRDTGVSLGAFTADEIKPGTIEVVVPNGADTRHEELTLNLGYGVDA